MLIGLAHNSCYRPPPKSANQSPHFLLNRNPALRVQRLTDQIHEKPTQLTRFPIFTKRGRTRVDQRECHSGNNEKRGKWNWTCGGASESNHPPKPIRLTATGLSEWMVSNGVWLPSKTVYRGYSVSIYTFSHMFALIHAFQQW
jgi:hypothetical protein